MSQLPVSISVTVNQDHINKHLNNNLVNNGEWLTMTILHKKVHKKFSYFWFVVKSKSSSLLMNCSLWVWRVSPLQGFGVLGLGHVIGTCEALCACSWVKSVKSHSVAMS